MQAGVSSLGLGRIGNPPVGCSRMRRHRRWQAPWQSTPPAPTRPRTASINQPGYALNDALAQVVQPALAALLARPAGNVLRNGGPVAVGAILADQRLQQLVLL